jgi:hypothetical protein
MTKNKKKAKCSSGDSKNESSKYLVGIPEYARERADIRRVEGVGGVSKRVEIWRVIDGVNTMVYQSGSV